MRALVAAVAGLLAALTVVGPAASHGGGPVGFRSKVTAIRPALPGLRVAVLDGDDRLLIVNGTGKAIVISGYEGEPYLRLARGLVSLNQRSPAAWLNDARYGGVDVPASADPTKPPAWVEVGPGADFEWHDHRVHWMSPIPPPAIEQAPNRPHHVFDWRIEGTADGEEFAILGTLDYVPPDDTGRSMLVIVLPVVLALGLLVPLLVLRPGLSRRSRRAASTVGGASKPRK